MPSPRSNRSCTPLPRVLFAESGGFWYTGDMGDQAAFLRGLLEDSVEGWPEVSWRRMFGCDAVFARGHIFGLVWKKDRLGLKIPDAAAYQALLDLPGAEPWTIGDKTMSRWVLVPESFHDDPDDLRLWAQRAYQAVVAMPPVVKKTKKAGK